LIFKWFVHAHTHPHGDVILLVSFDG